MKFALQDEMHHMFQEGEEWAGQQLAALNQNIDIDCGEIQESMGALCACFAPVKDLAGALMKNAFSRTEVWRTRANGLYLLLQLKHALEHESKTGNLAPQARKEMAKAVKLAIMERKALETDPKVRQVFGMEASAADSAHFRLASYKDPVKAAQADADDLERLTVELLSASDPAEKSELETKLNAKKEAVLKMVHDGTAPVEMVMIPMLQRIQHRMVQMEANQTMATKENAVIDEWSEIEDKMDLRLRSRIESLSELREKMDEETDPMQKQILLIDCRKQQVEIRLQLRNVEGIAQSLGIIIAFLDGMQTQLSSINSKLDKVSEEVQRLENRVAGRPVLSQILMYLADSEEQSTGIPDAVFIPTECLHRCEHAKFGFSCQKCQEDKSADPVFTESTRNKSQKLLSIVAEFVGGGKDGRHVFHFINKRLSGDEDVGSLPHGSIMPKDSATYVEEDGELKEEVTERGQEDSEKKAEGTGKDWQSPVDGPEGNVWKLGSMLIHGPAGSGKSSFAKETIKFVLQHCHYMRNQHDITVIPVIVNLPVMKNPLTELFEEGVKRQYGLRESQVFELKEKIQDPKSKIMVVFFLDGYDELKPEIRSKNLFKTNNLEVLRPRTSTTDSNTNRPDYIFNKLCHYSFEHFPKVVFLCRSDLIFVAFITGNSSLEPLIEGLYAQIHVNLR